MVKAIGREVFVLEVGERATRPAFERVSASDLKLQEAWFRDAIFANPELVIAPCRAADLVPPDETWMPWAVEHESGAGPMDVLLLSSHGRVGIVETKLSYNPEKRREVVAQILDYAINFQEAEELPPWPVSTALPDEVDVREKLARAEFLLIVAGDEIDARALKLGDALLAGHMTSEWDLAMVDLNLYRSRGEAEPSYLLVPEMRGVLRHETRQVVRVEVVGESPKARVTVERIPATSSARAKRVWDEATFLRDVAERLPADAQEAIRRLYEFAAGYGTLTFGTGETKGSFSAKFPRIADKSILNVYSNGRLQLQLPNMPEGVRAALVEGVFRSGGITLPSSQKYPEVDAVRWVPLVAQLIGALREVAGSP